ncbi:MAG TPA: PDZ domain-containing protein [Burkholderiales bacterium]|nr:PDZ domain-containing protein [Burkholderiales bacterium]
MHEVFRAALTGLRTATLLAALAACAQPPAPQVDVPHGDGVVPGTIGVVVRDEQSRVVVAAVKQNSPAAQRGVEVGDVVVSCNGEAVASVRQFNRLVLDSAPGSLVRLQILRAGAVRTLEVPVEQLDITPRV